MAIAARLSSMRVRPAAFEYSHHVRIALCPLCEESASRLRRSSRWLLPRMTAASRQVRSARTSRPRTRADMARLSCDDLTETSQSLLKALRTSRVSRPKARKPRRRGRSAVIASAQVLKPIKRPCCTRAEAPLKSRGPTRNNAERWRLSRSARQCRRERCALQRASVERAACGGRRV